ncbi:MAG: hypothetical protein ACI865_000171 [Flavobacteriaceae bacterium]|jgi:hypothetical protein
MFIHKVLCAFIFFSLSGVSSGQQSKCDTLLNTSMGSAMSNNDEITTNLETLLECGDYTSLTKKYFSEGHRVFGVMSEDIMRFIGDKEYSVLLRYIDSLIQDEVFKEKMWYTMELIRISEETTSMEVFETNERFFRMMEPDEIVFEGLRDFYATHPQTEMTMHESVRAFYTQKANEDELRRKNSIDPNK